MSIIVIILGLAAAYPQDDDWVLGGVFLQKVFECDGAGGQDDLVSFGLLSIAGDGDIHEVILRPEILEG